MSGDQIYFQVSFQASAITFGPIFIRNTRQFIIPGRSDFNRRIDKVEFAPADFEATAINIILTRQGTPAFKAMTFNMPFSGLNSGSGGISSEVFGIFGQGDIKIAISKGSKRYGRGDNYRENGKYGNQAVVLFF